jgi:hypothetical protein
VNPVAHFVLRAELIWRSALLVTKHARGIATLCHAFDFSCQAHPYRCVDRSSALLACCWQQQIRVLQTVSLQAWFCQRRTECILEMFLPGWHSCGSRAEQICLKQFGCCDDQNRKLCQCILKVHLTRQ